MLTGKPQMSKVHAAARRERGADYVQFLVPAPCARTRNWTGHREPHKKTAFACEAHGAGQHRVNIFIQELKKLSYSNCNLVKL